MNHLPTDYTRLLLRHIFRSLPQDEQESLEKHVEDSDDLMYVFEKVTDAQVHQDAKAILDPIDLQHALQRTKLRGKLQFKEKTMTAGLFPARLLQFNKWRTPYKVAAAVATAGLITIFLTADTGPGKPQSITKSDTEYIQGPVTLKRQDIDISSKYAHDVNSIKEGDSVKLGDYVFRRKNGRVLCELAKTKGAAESDILYTSPGSTVPVSLPDGSNIWLNALSSLQVMTGANGVMHVIITGEAYLQSADALSSPLILEVKDRMQIEVGRETQLNVNAYPDEPTVRTSVLKSAGDAKIIAGTKAALLKAGQEARFRGDSLVIVDMDVLAMDAAKAWKQGLFFFKSVNLESIMRQISRWYDVEVVYESKNIPMPNFFTSLTRDAKLTDVLTVLNLNGIDAKLKGKKLILKRK